MIKFYGVTDTETILLLIAMCLAGIAAILGSGITLSFYWRKKKIVPFLYRVMAVTDILTGLNAIYFVILCLTYLNNCNSSYYTTRRIPNYRRNKEDWISFNNTAVGCHRNDTFLIPASFVITAVVTRLPLFIGVVLSVVRTINIGSPFIQINKPIVALAIALWALIWSGLAIASTQITVEFDDHLASKIRVKDNFYRLLVNNPTPMEFSYLQRWQYMLMLIISFIVPIAVMLISTAVQLAFLFLTRMGGAGGSDHFQMTVTIILITVLAAVCAMPSSFYIAASWAKNQIGGSYAIDNTQAFVYGFGLPVLNSALNPVLLITRSTSLRDHVKRLARGEFKVDGRSTSAASTLSRAHTEVTKMPVANPSIVETVN